MTKYLVVETYYEYNDEYYHQGEGDAYTVEPKLYSDKKEAQKIADKKNKESKKIEDFKNQDDEPIEPFKVISVEE